LPTLPGNLEAVRRTKFQLQKVASSTILTENTLLTESVFWRQ